MSPTTTCPLSAASSQTLDFAWLAWLPFWFLLFRLTLHLNPFSATSSPPANFAHNFLLDCTLYSFRIILSWHLTQSERHSPHFFSHFFLFFFIFFSFPFYMLKLVNCSSFSPVTISSDSILHFCLLFSLKCFAPSFAVAFAQLIYFSIYLRKWSVRIIGFSLQHTYFSILLNPGIDVD